MTFAEMVTDLLSRIGSDPEVITARLKDWLNEGLLTFCNENPFYWLEREATASTEMDVARYTMPQNCKDIIEIVIGDDVYRKVPYLERHTIDPADHAFTQIGNNFILYPTPEETGSNNIELTYIRKPTKMSDDADSPSDSDIANMPEQYHAALTTYAFAVYQSYDEEHEERRDLVGNPNLPVFGTFERFLVQAKKEDERYKRQGKRRMMSRQEAIGYNHPNSITGRSPVLKI